MLFTLEALDAAHGDALLLHWRTGSGSALRTALIDGGPTVTWKATLKPRLLQLIAERGGELRLPFAMVSHVDDDHTGGFGKFFEWLDGSTPPRPVLIDTLWLNSFGAITAGRAATADTAAWPQEDAALDDFVTAAQQALQSFGERSAERDAAAVLTSVKQGAQIAGYAKRLRILRNSGEDVLMRPTAAGTFTRKRFGGLTLTVIAPAEADLDRLKASWKDMLKKVKAKTVSYAELADYVDKSVNNLSSIVVLAECGGRRMLLTGDARGDSVVAGLEDAGLLANGSVHVDVLKMPHHGSWRNMSGEFFRQVVADYYVFSADGKYDNPDEETIAALLDTREDDDFTLVLTNDCAGRAAWIERQRRTRKRHFRLSVREPRRLSVMVHLGDPL
ncbi:MAG: hypothetical protein C0497_09835 [Gemmatimonas sp.]|nr:hypothetical protein [Gemmatimonas sp.]